MMQYRPFQDNKSQDLIRQVGKCELNFTCDPALTIKNSGVIKSAPKHHGRRGSIIPSLPPCALALAEKGSGGGGVCPSANSTHLLGRFQFEC